MKFILLVLIVYAFRFGHCEEVSPANCFIWGPGLVSKANLPVRYFYIQARDQSNNLLVLIAYLDKTFKVFFFFSKVLMKINNL